MFTKSRRFVKLFDSRKGNLDALLNKDFIHNGIVTIPCQITDYHDIISHYSVKKYETLNTEFADFLNTSAEVTPDDCPLVLNIIGDCLSEEEKLTIRETIAEYYAYNLGLVEKDEKRHKRVFWGMIIGLLLSGILLWFTKALADEPREIFFILFWFMGDTLCDYIFLTGHDLRQNRRLAGRLASIKVLFSNSFEKPEYSENDADKIYSEIEKM